MISLSFTGKVSAIVLATRDQKNEETVTRIKYKFDEIDKTHILQHGRGTNCFELFLLEGDASEVAPMVNEFQKSDEIKSVKLITI